MATFKRISTKYPGVFYIEGASTAGNSPERIYYIRYRKSGKSVEEEAAKKAESNKWTLDRLSSEYFKSRPDNKAKKTDQGRYINFIQPRFGSKQPLELVPLDIDRYGLTF